MTAIARKTVSIVFAPAGTNPVAAISAGTIITGQIKNYKQSGGETDVESVPHFGGYQDKEKPQSQIEVEMEITPTLESADVWDSLMLAAHSTGPFTFKNTGASLAIFIQATATAGSKTRAFNNVTPSSLEISHEADDNQTGTVKFKMAPQTLAGVNNYQTKNVAIASLTAWSLLV